VGQKLKSYLAETYATFLIVVMFGGFIFVERPGLIRLPALRQTRPLSAAVIDELAATAPDPDSVNNMTISLEKAGYKVDYYGPKEVTVDLFKRLPSLGYGILVLRSHSTGWVGDVIATVTSEPYSADKYTNEQLANQVVRVHIGVDNKDYFGITPKFVRELMQGTFSSSIVIMMGCTGLINSEMAQAFVARGAEVFISWKQVIFVNRADGAAEALIQLMIGGRPVKEAVAVASEAAPPGPDSNSQLAYYPLDRESLVLSSR